jgi:hypothetical protein
MMLEKRGVYWVMNLEIIFSFGKLTHPFFSLMDSYAWPSGSFRLISRGNDFVLVALRVDGSFSTASNHLCLK